MTARRAELNCAFVPTLFILNGWKIQMFARERHAPHIHVETAGEVFRFYISDFSQMPTDYRRAPAGMARKVREWGERNRRALESVQQAILTGEAVDKSLFVDI